MGEKKLLTENELDANGGAKYDGSLEFVPAYKVPDYTKSGNAEGLYAAADAADSEGRRYNDLRRWNQADEAALGFVSAGMVNPSDIEIFTVPKDGFAPRFDGMGRASADGNAPCLKGWSGAVAAAEAGDRVAINADAEC